MRRFRVPALLALCAGALGAAPRARADDPPAAERERPRLVAQLGHSHWVGPVAISPDARWVLTGGWDGMARLWERETGREVRTYPASTQVTGLHEVGFSPDSRLALGVDKGVAYVWERATGREVLKRGAPEAPVAHAAFAHDSLGLFTGSPDGLVLHWDLGSGLETQRYTSPAKGLTSLASAVDGRWVLAGFDEGPVALWERASGRLTRIVPVPKGGSASLALSPDGRWGLSSGADSALLFEVETGRTLHAFTTHAGAAGAFSTDGTLVLTAGGYETTISVWDRDTGRALRTQPGPDITNVSHYAFSRDARWVVASGTEMRASLWDLEPAESAIGRSSPANATRVYEGASSAIASVTLSPDGRGLLTASGNVMNRGEVELARRWDLEAGHGERTYKGHAWIVSRATESADGRWVLTGSWDGTARLWDRDTGAEVRRFTCPLQVLGSAISADGRWVATGSDDGLLRLWDRETALEVRTCEGHYGGVWSAAFSPDGSWVVSGDGNGQVIVHDRESGKELRRWSEHGVVQGLAVSWDGRFVATAVGARPRLWDPATGTEVQQFQATDAGGGGFASVAFSRDGRRLVTGDFHGDAAHLWDVQTGQQLRRLAVPGSRVDAVAFSADGRWVFTGGADCRTRVWEADTGRERCSLLGFRDGTWAVVDPEGRYDASHEGKVEGLHWVLGDEVITLDQLQSAYYEPGLLAKVLSGAPLLQVPDFARIGLFPTALATAPTAADPHLRLDLENRGGGIGRVVVKIDGTAIASDSRGAGTDPAAPRAHVDVDLSHHPLLAPGRESRITVEVYNADGSLRSRGVELLWTPPGEAEAAPPEFWAVVCGVSDYHGDALDLRYAAKDALAFSGAIRGTAEGLFGAEHLHVTTLATEGPFASPTRDHLKAALLAARQARRDDVFILYLSGHGVMAGTPPDYHYLTQEATSTDLSLDAVRSTRAVSATELEEWLRWIPARKKVLVFDTCRAGEAAKRLGDRGADAGDQKRALARVRQALGTYMLAGCASDRVSYEASRYAQGLLTYALLEGMKVGAKEATREGDLLEAMGLLSYAMRRVPELAKGIGGLQEPQLSVPDLATPIDLGRLTTKAKEGIHLAGERPLFVKPRFDLERRPGDPVGLTKAVEAALARATDARGEAALAYVEVEEGAGALLLSGRYRVEGTRLLVHAYLSRFTDAGSTDVGDVTLEGTASEPGPLAAKVVEQALKLATAK